MKIRKYLPFWGLQCLAVGLWMFWVLPVLRESGTDAEMLKWLGIQVLVPAFLLLLISGGRKSGYVLTAAYGILIGLYSMGILGWSLVGAGTPVSVYMACFLFFIVAFGLVFTALNDLNVGQKERRYDEIKNE